MKSAKKYNKSIFSKKFREGPLILLCQIVKRPTMSCLEFVWDLNLLLFSLSTPYHAVSSLVLQLSHERGAKCRDRTKSNFLRCEIDGSITAMLDGCL